MTYRQQIAEPVSLLPKTLRTFKQYLIERGGQDYRDGLIFEVDNADWLDQHEKNAYHRGYWEAHSFSSANR